MKQEHSQFARTYPPQATNYHFDGTPEILLDLSGPKSTLHPVDCSDLLVSIQKRNWRFFSSFYKLYYSSSYRSWHYKNKHFGWLQNHTFVGVFSHQNSSRLYWNKINCIANIKYFRYSFIHSLYYILQLDLMWQIQNSQLFLTRILPRLRCNFLHCYVTLSLHCWTNRSSYTPVRRIWWACENRLICQIIFSVRQWL